MNAALNENMPVGDVVVKFPQTRELLETLGIDYCCGGKVPLNQAAEQAGLAIGKVLADLTKAVESTEKDLHEHIHLENNILFRNAQRLEEHVH